MWKWGGGLRLRSGGEKEEEAREDWTEEARERKSLGREESMRELEAECHSEEGWAPTGGGTQDADADAMRETHPHHTVYQDIANSQS
jgi:hypothetical protein